MLQNDESEAEALDRWRICYTVSFLYQPPHGKVLRRCTLPCIYAPNTPSPLIVQHITLAPPYASSISLSSITQ